MINMKYLLMLLFVCFVCSQAPPSYYKVQNTQDCLSWFGHSDLGKICRQSFSSNT